jgi:hypothetical protein
MAPAEAQQIIEQRLGQDAELVAIGVDAERAVALAELGAVRAVDQRDMGVGRLGPAHRADDRQLAEGVVEMVVAADDVGDAHVVIVDHHRQHVGRRAVGAEQDEIVELGVLDGDPALDLVVDRRLALARRLEADDEGLVPLLGRSRRATAVDPERRARPAPSRAARRAPPASCSSDRRAPRSSSSCATSAWRAQNCDWKYSWPSQSRPSQRMPSRIASIAGWSSGPCRCPRCAAGTCRRGGGRTAS